MAVAVWRWPCGGGRVAVAVWRWPCGGHMTCHVTWKDNPLRVTVKNFGDYKILKILIINKNLDFIFRSLKIMVPFFKNLNYRQKLLIVDFIIHLRQYKLSGIKGNKVKLSIKAFLGKDYP